MFSGIRSDGYVNFLISIFLLIPTNALSVPDDPNSPDFQGSHTVDENGAEKTKRNYVLVKDSGEKIEVVSNCHKDFPAEAPFGACEHHLHFTSTGKTYTLREGDTVYLAPSPFGDIATMTYGCCAEPASYTFYDYDMKPLGSLQGYIPLMSNDTTQHTLDMKNVSSGKMYLEETYGPKNLHDVILEKDKNGDIKRIPVDIEFTDPNVCEYWLFVSYSDNAGKPKFSFTGQECNGEASGFCEKAENGLKCLLSSH